MLALLWARADAGRLERLGHQMLKYETYLVPTLAGMDAILGRYTARIRRDTDTRRLPAVARRDLLEWLGQRFFGAAWTPRDFANWARGRARYERFIRDYARTGRARPRGDRRAQALRADSSSTRSSAGSGPAGCRAPPCCAPPRRPRPTRSAGPTSGASRRARRPTSSSSPETRCAAWPTRVPSGPSSSAGGSSSRDSLFPRSRTRHRVRRRLMKMLRVLGILLALAAVALPASPVAGPGPRHRRRRADDRQPRPDRQAVRGGRAARRGRGQRQGRHQGAQGRDPGGGRQGGPQGGRHRRPEVRGRTTEILAVLGHYSSSACFAAIPIYTRARLATITPSASHTDLTKQGGKYMFRMWSPISVYVPDLAQYTVKKLGKKNIGVVYVQNDWGIQTKDYFVKELEKLGARVAALEVVYDKDTDFKAQLTKIKAANPDALAILTYYTTGALADAPGAEPRHQRAARRHRHPLRGEVPRDRRQGERRGARREHGVQRGRSGARRQELRRHVPEAPPWTRSPSRTTPRRTTRRASSSRPSRRPGPTATRSGTPSPPPGASPA